MMAVFRSSAVLLQLWVRRVKRCRLEDSGRFYSFMLVCRLSHCRNCLPGAGPGPASRSFVSGPGHDEHGTENVGKASEKPHANGRVREQKKYQSQFPYRLEPPPEDHVDTQEETSVRFRRSYMSAYDCTPCNTRPEGCLTADIADCMGVGVARRRDYRDLLVQYGGGTWMWVVVTCGFIKVNSLDCRR